MQPIGLLMIEHRLIERFITLMQDELYRMENAEKADVVFIDSAVDFIRTYADQCHHGKEEDILFRDLDKKDLSAEHARIMKELIEEHVQGRKMVSELLNSKEKYASGDENALKEIKEYFIKLAEFYPRHIEKEDKHFFIPVMKYFNREEIDNMLQECYMFDRTMIHNKYKSVVSSWEKTKK